MIVVVRGLRRPAPGRAFASFALITRISMSISRSCSAEVSGASTRDCAATIFGRSRRRTDFPSVGEMQRVGAPVGAVDAAFDQAFRFQPIDELADIGPVQPHQRRQARADRCPGKSSKHGDGRELGRCLGRPLPPGHRPPPTRKSDRAAAPADRARGAGRCCRRSNRTAAMPACSRKVWASWPLDNILTINILTKIDNILTICRLSSGVSESPDFLMLSVACAGPAAL